MKIWESALSDTPGGSCSIGKVDGNEKLRWSSHLRPNLVPGGEINFGTISGVKHKSEVIYQPKVASKIKPA